MYHTKLMPVIDSQDIMQVICMVAQMLGNMPQNKIFACIKLFSLILLYKRSFLLLYITQYIYIYNVKYVKDLWTRKLFAYIASTIFIMF